ncbi:MAG: hypothetical protein K2O75_08720 [Lactobacillus sp.]|uniref:hypothetical protein n=1 Tax=Lactobacillus sp. TaxID=1591 RepID=UPI0023BF8278|nr:hypothetical protein [Lactobacillus sp.]MDE7050926.1 hypothetical protein [Lactobacillus sp.]
MKRSKLGVAITAFFITFLAVGCSNTSSNNSSNNSSDKYTTYMNQGKDAASSQKYETAEEKFEDAHDVKATSESKAYADQAGDMKDAKEEIREYEFKDALGELDKAANKTNGYSVMTKQASKLYKTIDTVQDHITHDINPLYKQAKLSYRDSDYQAAVESCDQILDLPYINGKYYKKVKKNVKHLRKVANAKLNGEDVNDDIDTENLDANDDDEATTSHKQSTSSKSSSSNSSNTNSNTTSNSNQNSSNSTNTQNSNEASKQSSHTNASSNNAANSNSNTNSSSNSDNSGMMINGQTVTGRVIAQTRNQLSSIGVDTSSWSDQEVVNFMRSAANNGHTTIDSYTKQDVENFK